MRVAARKAPLKNTKFGRLHPFQEKLIEALLDRRVFLVNVEAPVGVGKTTAIRKALEVCEQPIVATFPTMILINTQASKITEGSKVFHWPKTLDPSDQDWDFGLIEYSTHSLLNLAINKHSDITNLKRGELLDRLFSLTPLIAKKRMIITTPDVLWLIYSGKYSHARRLQLALTDAIVFFDEFHCYCDLRNFYLLLQLLAEKGVSKIILMSATPFMRQDIHLDFPGDQVDIRFEEEQGLEQRTFNFPLNVEIIEGDYYNLDKLVEMIKSCFKDLPRPAALIFDSIFRLMQIEPMLKKEFPHLQFYRYDGLKKESFVLDKKSVVLGTSSIEIGIDMDFASMVCEGSSWPAVIQRLGRAGRRRRGNAFILSDRNFKPYMPAQKEISRKKFEDILKQYLPDPREDWTSGELFRGDSPNFLLIDEKGGTYFYGPGIFSMYDIAEWDYYTSNTKEMQKILVEMGADESALEEVLTRLYLFPVAGIVKAKGFRERYVPIELLEPSKTEWVIKLRNGQSFYFEREVIDD